MGRNDSQAGKGQGNGEARGGGREENQGGRGRQEGAAQDRNGDEDPVEVNDYGAFDTTGDDPEQIGGSG